jgi:hypothetical protein
MRLLGFYWRKKMALTRDFRETVMALCEDPEYRKALLVEIAESYLDGDIKVGNSMLKDYLNATQSFELMAEQMGCKVESLRRMVGPNGNAVIRNMFTLLKLCQRREGIEYQVEYVDKPSEVDIHKRDSSESNSLLDSDDSRV